MTSFNKFTFTIGLLVALSPLRAFAELPDGHWLSEKYDKTRAVTITFENWFEEDAVEGRVFHQKEVRETAAPSFPAPAPRVEAAAPWFCYSHDFIDGHLKSDPSDSSCISRFYKGWGTTCKEDAIVLALKRCKDRSSNKATCTIDVENNCYASKELFKSENE